MMLSITNTPFLQKVHFLTIQVLFLCCAAAAAEAVAAGQSKIEISIFEMKGAWVKKKKNLRHSKIFKKKEKNVSKVTKKFQKRS